jgi:zinc transport system substrate-binding protein
MKRSAAVSVLLLGLLIFAYPVEGRPVKVFVSIAPQQYFVKKVGGSLVDVSVLVPPGFEPHTYEPKPRQMAALAKAAVFFTVGLEFEKVWLKKIAATNPRMQVVATDEGVAKLAMAGRRHEQEEGHATGRRLDQHPARHDDGGPDPHIWLSPPLVKIQAKAIAEGLSAVDPANRTRYEENYAAFEKEIGALDAELRSLFAGCRGARFMVFHPSWGYFAQAYGLEQVPIEIEGKDPKPAQLQELIRQAKQEDVKVVFVQPQFSAKSAEMVARAIGGQVLAVDPLAADWAENLLEVGRKIKAAFP